MANSIGFVILHYCAMQETLDCVESIKRHIDTESYYIVIVDNASPNGTGNELAKLFRDDYRVKVLLNKENEGFARGNNLGYRYLMKKHPVDFICILNNDTLLLQDDFLAVIRKEYEKSRFGVMGPKILLADDSVNPIYLTLPDEAFFEAEYRRMSRTDRLMRIHMDRVETAGKMLTEKARKLTGRERASRFSKYVSLEEAENRHVGAVLHGCCLVFSKAYMETYGTAFDPRTFVYHEEELLWLRCRDKALVTVYNPELTIRHLEDAATDQALPKKREKLRFYYKNQTKSLAVLLHRLKEE